MSSDVKYNPKQIAEFIQELYPFIDAGIATRVSHSEQLNLKKNSVLFYAGDKSDCFYINLQGILGVFEKCDGSKNLKLIDTTLRGESIGENGVITRKHREFTVRALSDCMLLKLSSHQLLRYCLVSPRLLFALTNMIIERSQSKNIRRRQRKILILYSEKTRILEYFFKRFEPFCDNHGSIGVIDSEYLRSTESRGKGYTTFSLSHKLTQKELLIFLIDVSDLGQLDISSEQYDTVYCLIDSSSQNSVLERNWPSIIETIPYQFRKELLLISDNIQASIELKRRWRNLDKFSICHSVRLKFDTDLERLMRFLTGKPNIVVLSGGGARSWAHLGALKAIVDTGVSIDAIGGSSIGAVVAACYCTTKNIDEMVKKYRSMAVKQRRALWPIHLTIPHVSIFTGNDGTKSLRKHFDDVLIEDLNVPFFCVSCNLNSATEVVWREGVLWKKLRGTVAIPGLWPPMVEDGQAYLDGGLVNNLPVDSARDVIASEGTVIALDISVNRPHNTVYRFPPVMSINRGLKILAKSKKYVFPSLRKIVYESITMGTVTRTLNNRDSADYLIDLAFEGKSFFSFDEDRELIAKAYEHTMEMLKAWGGQNGRRQKRQRASGENLKHQTLSVNFSEHNAGVSAAESKGV